MALTLAIIQNILASVYGVQTRFAAKALPSGQWSITFWTFFVLVLSGIGVSISMGGIELSSVNLKMMMLITFASFCFGAGTGLLFYSYRKLDAAVVQIISSIRIPLIALLSVFLLGQTLRLSAFIGVALILTGIYIVTERKTKKSPLSLATVVALLVSVLFAIGVVIQKTILDALNLSTFLLVSWSMELVSIVFVALLFKASIRIDKRIAKHALPMGITRAMGGLVFVWMLQNIENTTFVGAMTGLSLIFTTLFAGILLKETKRIKTNILASLVGFLGIFLIYM